MDKDQEIFHADLKWVDLWKHPDHAELLMTFILFCRLIVSFKKMFAVTLVLSFHNSSGEWVTHSVHKKTNFLSDILLNVCQPQYAGIRQLKHRSYKNVINPVGPLCWREFYLSSKINESVGVVGRTQWGGQQLESGANPLDFRLLTCFIGQVCAYNLTHLLTLFSVYSHTEQLTGG